MRFPRRVLFALAAACAFSGAARAQPEITRQMSPGGLPFRHVLMADQPMQSLQFAWVDTRALTDPGKEALAALGPSLVMQGPEGSSPSAMAEDLRDFQASMSLSSNGSHTRGWLNAPLKSFSEASAVLRRTLATPALPQDRLTARQRNAVVASRQAAENPDTLSRRLLGRLMLGDSAMTRLASGDPESYARVTRADIAAWARETFVRAGLEIVMAGPMLAKDAGIILDEVFGALPQGEAHPPSPPRTLRSSGKLILLERPVAQTIIAMAGPTTLTVSEHFVRADMMVGVLGGGSQSRLFRSVRDRLGAAYGVSTNLTPTDSRGFALSIRAAVANDRAKEALAAIREDYARFLAEGVTAAEIDPLRTRVISNRAEALRRSGNVASLVLNATLFGLPEGSIATYAGRVAGYSLEEFNGELRHFPAPPLTTVVIAPSAEGFGADCVIKSPDEISRCE